MVTCPSCRATTEAARWLPSARAYWRALRLVRLACPTCGAEAEVRPGPGALEVGYTYAAGTAHFSPEVHVEVPGLAIREVDDTLELALGDLVVRAA